MLLGRLQHIVGVLLIFLWESTGGSPVRKSTQEIDMDFYLFVFSNLDLARRPGRPGGSSTSMRKILDIYQKSDH